MSKHPADLLIELSLEEGDAAELDELTRQLRSEVEDLNIDSITQVSTGMAPAGTKAVDLAALGQLAVTLAPAVIPPLFGLLKSWVERRLSTPVKIKVKVGRREAQVEYDPTRTSPKDLELLVEALNQALKK